MLFRKKDAAKPAQQPLPEPSIAKALEAAEWKRSIWRILDLADSEAKNSPDRVWGDAYTFFIDMLGRELVGHYGCRSFDYKYGIDLRQLVCLPGNLETGPDWPRKVVKAGTMNLVCFPRNLGRLPTTINNIKTSGYRNDTNELCKGTYYPELNLCVVDNRHHHVAVAESMNAASDIDVEVKVISIAQFFDDLSVDNDLCWTSKTHPEFADVPVDPRFTTMYALAKQRAAKSGSTGGFRAKIQ